MFHTTTLYFFLGELDTDVFQAYLKKHTPVIQELDGRIKIIHKYNDTATAGTEGQALHSLSIWFLLLFSIHTILN